MYQMRLILAFFLRMFNKRPAFYVSFYTNEVKKKIKSGTRPLFLFVPVKKTEKDGT
jgi:hypothetical protein